jgi:isoquinoline 1-oxidoreductase
MKPEYVAESAQRIATRREVLQVLGASTVILIIDGPTPVHAFQEEEDLLRSPNAVLRLKILPEGKIELRTGKVELGQGVSTLLAQCAAEEFNTTPDKIQLIMGDTAVCPDDGGTWASATTPETVPATRKAAAQAAQHEPKPPAQWTTLGRSTPNRHARAIITGKQTYATDFRPPNHHAAVILRSTHYNASLLDYQPKQVANAQLVRDGDLLAVIAPTRAAAERAASAITPTWRATPLATPRFKENAQIPLVTAGARYPAVIQQGDPRRATGRAVTSTYTVANIAHVPLEPRAAHASWNSDRLTVHSGTQAPFLVRKELAQYFKIPESQVRVIALPVGGGYGGKQRGECELEAARLAKLSGRAVSLHWTRQDEFNRAYLRPAGIIEVATKIDPTGRIAAWDFHNYNSGPSGLKPPYDIPHQFSAYHRSQPIFREGSYRSLAAVANNFARESHIDELAAELQVDPLDLRLRHITDPRLREAIERAAQKFGWSKRSKFSGMAINLEKDARLALFVEIELTKNGPRAARVVNAFDPGAILNPANLRNQIEGAIIQGLGGALFERIAHDDTTVLNSRLLTYRLPRFQDTPKIESILIDRREIPPAGCGESPITTIAPALANAIFAATGQRIRKLPLWPSKPQIP